MRLGIAAQLGNAVGLGNTAQLGSTTGMGNTAQWGNAAGMGTVAQPSPGLDLGLGGRGAASHGSVRRQWRRSDSAP